MSDGVWLMRAATLTGAALEEGEAARLSGELGDPREVLPHLLLMRGAMAGWPAARAALASAAKAVIRPRPLTPTPGAAVQEARATCRDAVLRALAPREDGDCWAADSMIRLRPRVSAQARPNDFIATS